MNRYLLLLTVFLSALFFIPKNSHKFSLKTISAELPFNAEWEGNGELEDSILEQTYRYLGGGGQSFAFLSEDGKYVIKFFKQYKFAIPLWRTYFPHEKKRVKMQNKRNIVFSAFKSSFDHLMQETGLIFIHLNATSHLKKTLKLYDHQNHFHLLDLDSLQFVVQKKADLAFDRIDALMKNHDVLGATRAIDQLLTLPQKLTQKGFRNRDSNFRSNYGFVDSQAICFDVGRIVYSNEIKKKKNFNKDFLRMTQRFRNYLTHRHPELLPYFENSVKDIYTTGD